MLDDTKTKWPLKPLSEVVDLNPRLDKSGYQDDLEVSFVPMAAVEAGSGRMEVSQTKHFSAVKKGYTPFREGDVLFAKITPCMENGKMAVVPKLTNGMGFGSTEFHVLRPRPSIEPRYVYHFVSNMSFRREAARHMTGAVGQKRVPTSFLEDASIPVPPFDQQMLLVAEIEKQFSRLDEAVANLKRVKANLKRYKAAVLKAAVEGKLTEEWRKQHPNVEPASRLLERILSERREKWNGRGKYKEPVVPDTNELPSLPKGWTWATVEQLAAGSPGAIQSGPFGSQLLHSEFVDDGILAIGIDNVLDAKFSLGRQHRITPAKFKALEKFAAHPADVVITVMATVGRVCVLPQKLEPAIITKHCYRITPAPGNVDSEFLAVALRADSATRQHIFGNVRGQTRPGINGPILKAAPVSLAPFFEQKEIIAEVERRLSVIEELEATVEANLTRADRLRQAILSRAFSGRLNS
jgi:type I restriction enzyme S subunit